jgi:hypothetical protein
MGLDFCGAAVSAAPGRQDACTTSYKKTRSRDMRGNVRKTIFALDYSTGASNFCSLITLSLFWSISKGSPFIFTRMRYSFAGSLGTRHEYEQVKPQPYSKLPV